MHSQKGKLGLRLTAEEFWKKFVFYSKGNEKLPQGISEKESNMRKSFLSKLISKVS